MWQTTSEALFIFYLVSFYQLHHHFHSLCSLRKPFHLKVEVEGKKTYSSDKTGRACDGVGMIMWAGLTLVHTTIQLSVQTAYSYLWILYNIISDKIKVKNCSFLSKRLRHVMPLEQVRSDLVRVIVKGDCLAAQVQLFLSNPWIWSFFFQISMER